MNHTVGSMIDTESMNSTKTAMTKSSMNTTTHNEHNITGSSMNFTEDVMIDSSSKINCKHYYCFILKRSDI